MGAKKLIKNKSTSEQKNQNTNRNKQKEITTQKSEEFSIDSYIQSSTDTYYQQPKQYTYLQQQQQTQQQHNLTQQKKKYSITPQIHPKIRILRSIQETNKRADEIQITIQVPVERPPELPVLELPTSLILLLVLPQVGVIEVFMVDYRFLNFIFPVRK
ncbi:hypothetical protein ABPG72_013630 [Tetrahymena utriculariae]